MNLSATSAFAAGFRAIGREPLAPLAWGAITAVVFLPLQLFQMQFLWPSTMKMYGELMRGAPQAAAAVSNQNSTMVGISMLAVPVALLMWSVVGAAAIRSVLEPEDRRFFFIRLGKRELWLLLVLIVLVVLMYIGLIAGVIGTALVIGLLALVGAFFASLLSASVVLAWVGGVILVLLMVAGGIGAFLGMTWLAVRFSMAPVMTVNDGQFRLFESWRMTKGYGWKLVGLALLIMVSLLAFQILFVGIGAGIGAAFGLANIGRLQSVLLNPEDWLGRAMPVIAIGMLVFTVLGGYFQALMITPWADAYRQIAGRRNVAEVF